MRSKQNKLKRKVSRYQRAGAPKTDFDSELNKLVSDKLEKIKIALRVIMKQSNTWTVAMVTQLTTARSCIDDTHLFLESLLDVIIGPRSGLLGYRPMAYMRLQDLGESDFLRTELQNEIIKVKEKLANIKTALDVRFDDKSLFLKCGSALLYIDEIHASLIEVIHYINNGFTSDGNRIDRIALGKYQIQQIENAAHAERLLQLCRQLIQHMDSVEIEQLPKNIRDLLNI